MTTKSISEDLVPGEDREVDIPAGFLDIALVMDNGAKKHGKDSWLDPDNPSLEHNANHASMFRHLAESSTGIIEDEESGLHPLLHLATRALMAYTRYKIKEHEAEQNRKYNRSDLKYDSRDRDRDDNNAIGTGPLGLQDASS